MEQAYALTPKTSFFRNHMTASFPGGFKLVCGDKVCIAGMKPLWTPSTNGAVRLWNPCYYSSIFLTFSHVNKVDSLYLDSRDKFGNINRIYCNAADAAQYKTEPDVAADIIRNIRVDRLHLLNQTIQNFPDSNFTTDGKLYFIPLFKQVEANINGDHFNFAIDGLQKIRSHMDGYVGGKLADDWLIDTVAQKSTTKFIDGIVARLYDAERVDFSPQLYDK